MNEETFKKEVEKVKALKEGDAHFVSMGEESGGEIMKGLDCSYLLYDIKEYGGALMFEGWYESAEDAVKEVSRWT